jgi:predicted O-methyltransferase YrrM
MGLIRKLNYLPYLSRPALWPELGRRINHWLQVRGSNYDPALTAHHKEQAQLEAEAWCRSQAIPQPQLLTAVCGPQATLLSIHNRYQAELEAAEKRTNACPVRLGGAGNIDLLYTLCEELQARTVIETGVAYGWSSLAILLSLQHRMGTRLYSIDLPYMQLHNDRWVGLAVPEKLRDRWQLFRMADREGLVRALRVAGQLDVAHYDSDKSYEGRMWAYQALWSALRPKGILISDDIGDNLAFHDFSRQVQIQPFVIADRNKFQGILVKSSS